MSPYSITLLTDADMPLLIRWLRMPHVRQWRNDDIGFEGADALNDLHTRHHIVRLGEHPIGYIKAYDPHAWPGHYFTDQPHGTRGVDYYIGEVDFLSHGHGTAVIRQFSDQLIAAGAPVIVAGPHPNDERAIRDYEAAGLRTYGGPLNSGWGRCLLMARHA